jgi:hypothetical protein
VAYFSALGIVTLQIYIHIFLIFIIFDSVDKLPMNRDDLKIVKFIKIAILMLPISVVIRFLVKPNDLKKAEYDEMKIKKGGVYLVVYFIAIVLLLFVLMIAFSKSQ